jgi:hypothetical protein
MENDTLEIEKPITKICTVAGDGNVLWKEIIFQTFHFAVVIDKTSYKHKSPGQRTKKYNYNYSLSLKYGNVKSILRANSKEKLRKIALKLEDKLEAKGYFNKEVDEHMMISLNLLPDIEAMITYYKFSCAITNSRMFNNLGERL